MNFDIADASLAPQGKLRIVIFNYVCFHA